MIRAEVMDHWGVRRSLPVLTGWRFSYGDGEPCDAFELSCLWEEELPELLTSAVELAAFWNGEQIFAGRVDEAEVSLSGAGKTAALSGRGMGALLLDNEALPAEYHRLHVRDLLRIHAEPFGIRKAEYEDFAADRAFSVETGSSQWKVIADFARYFGGVKPRFGRDGTLLLKQTAGEVIRLTERTPVTAATRNERRYGVLSRVLVRDKARQRTETVENREFLERGGMARRVVNTPGRSNYAAMRYTGEYQIRRSQEDQSLLRLEVPLGFFAFPGDRLRLEREILDCAGMWRVREAECRMDGKGLRTELLLAPGEEEG